MNPDLLLAHFDRVSNAPDAILRLRRFILDLAVRGKLVEQDLSDEPASELLKRIQNEKERLSKAGELRRQRPMSPVESDEVPFAAPLGWEWTRIRQVTSDRGQKTPDKDFTYIDGRCRKKHASAPAFIPIHVAFFLALEEKTELAARFGGATCQRNHLFRFGR